MSDCDLVGLTATGSPMSKLAWLALALPLPPRSGRQELLRYAEKMMGEVAAQRGLVLVGSPVARAEPCGRWQIVVKVDAMAEVPDDLEEDSYMFAETISGTVEPIRRQNRWLITLDLVILLALILWWVF